jgi:aminoglycoside phosphotransferase (APT) family kinase protein
MSLSSTPPEIAYATIARTPSDLQQPVPAQHIVAMSRLAFGPETIVRAADELAGGEINNVYRVTLGGLDGASRSVMLRVAPPLDASLHWHEVALMRREHAIAPYLAPLGTLLPQTLFVDFTHQIIPRDYLFQTAMPGENWRAIEAELDAAATDALWRELAEIARRLHAVEGEAFGYPSPLPTFARWSECVQWEVEQVIAEVQAIGEDCSALRTILSFIRAHPEPLDAIRTPRLAHGDLWTFNVLVDRSVVPPRITAVLDGDRAYWGDPLADWTFHLLPRKASERVRAVFWHAYGPREETPEAACRWTIYEAKHAGNVLAIAVRIGSTRAAAEAREHLAYCASRLGA